MSSRAADSAAISDRLNADSADAPPDLFPAIQEQLGLRLIATKASIDVLVVDCSREAFEN